MKGEIPVWFFSLCLAVAVPAAFLAGFHWTGLARRLRMRRLVRHALARLEGRQEVVLPGDSREPVDTTRFTR